MSEHEEPTPWRDGGEELGEELLGALRASAEDFPEPRSLAAVEASLLAHLAAPPPAPTPTAAAATSSSAAAWLAPAALLTLVLAGVAFVAWPQAPAATPPLSTPQPPTSEPSTPEPSTPESAPPPSRGPADPTVPEPQAPQPSPPPLDHAVPRPTEARHTPSHRPDEATLLERARRVIRSRPRVAQSHLRAHRRLYPDGVLNEERDALWIEALRRRGQAEEARRAFARFETRYPRSVHLMRTRALVSSPAP